MIGLAVFVKTPGITPLKTRLASVIGKDAAEEFYRLSLNSLREVLKDTPFHCYWAVAERLALSDPLWSELDTVDQGEGSLGERLSSVYDFLLDRHECVSFIGADCPQVTPEILKSASNFDSDFCLAKSRDGGFWYFAGKKRIPKKIWLEISYSCESTFDELRSKLMTIGTISKVDLKLSDADYKEDLKFIKNEMPLTPNKFQIDIIRWIERWG